MFGISPESRFTPCVECGAWVPHGTTEEHVCDGERVLDFRIFQLRGEIAAFDAQLAAWLSTGARALRGLDRRTRPARRRSLRLAAVSRAAAAGRSPSPLPGQLVAVVLRAQESGGWTSPLTRRGESGSAGRGAGSETLYESRRPRRDRMTRRVKAVLAAAFLVTALQVAPAAGMPQSEPNGPWEIPNQHESLSAIRDYPQLIATLESIVASSNGAATLTYSPFRAKGSGRAIPIVTIGDGPRGIMIIANQHGDEYVVSNSAVEIVRALTRNSAWARSVRDELTVTIMPRVNIDGFDANPSGSPWRTNVDPNVCPAPTPCPAFYTRGRGYDINRYHSYLVSDPRDDPNTGPVGTGQGDNPVPEALAARPPTTLPAGRRWSRS